MHDLDERRVASSLCDGAGRAHDRAYLHLVDLGPLEPNAAAPRPQHRVRLTQRPDAPAHALVLRILLIRKELVQRRVEQPDRHREAGHCLEDPFEVGPLHRQQPVERGAAAPLLLGHDHLLHDGEPVLRHEHVLRAAEADPLRAELARLRRVVRRVGVGAHLQAAVSVAPLEDRFEVVVHLRWNERHLADDHRSRTAVERQCVAFLQRLPGEGHRARVDVDRERVATGHAWLAHATCDHRCVGRHAPVRRQHAGRLDEPVDVVGCRLPAHEDHALPRLAPLLGGVGVEDDVSGGCARRRIQPFCGHVPIRGRIEHRMQELVELRRVDARDRFLLRDQAFGNHVHSSLDRCGRRSLRRARLQEIEIVVLDGELDVLHVAVVLLQPSHRLE